MLAEKISDDIKEFFLPKDFGEFCVGCTKCFTESETKCPHYEKLKPLTDAMDEANVIILASPVYVYHATGAMKAFLDHYGYRLFFWGVAKRYKYGVGVAAVDWNGVS